MTLQAGCEEWRQKMLSDAQTSGGLLTACSPDAVGAAFEVFQPHGCGDAAVIGALVAGSPHITVR